MKDIADRETRNAERRTSNSRGTIPSFHGRRPGRAYSAGVLVPRFPIRVSRFAFRDSSAYTLLELIIVMTLASVVLGIAVLAFANRLPAARLGAAATDLCAAMRLLQTRAEQGGEDQTLSVDLDARQYGPTGGPMKSIPAGITVTAEDPTAGEILHGTYSILFPSTGGVEGGRIILAHGHKTISVEADPIVGGEKR